MRNFILIALIIFFAGCEEYMDVTFDNNSAKKLVVEGMITTDTAVHQVVLSWSGDFFEKGEQNMETGAEVTITDGIDVFHLHEAFPGTYLTDADFYGVKGKTYTLQIRLKDASEYTATETIAALPEIDSITLRYGGGYASFSPTATMGYGVSYFGQEPAGTGDFYFWSLYLNGVLYTDSIFKNLFSDDKFVDGSYIKDLEMFFVPESHLPSDTVEFMLKMYSISKQYNEYLISLMLETVWKGSPWDGPPANAVGNVSNGALGYFRANDVKRAKKVLVRSTEQIVQRD
jgi:hypothetical protein